MLFLAAFWVWIILFVPVVLLPACMVVAIVRHIREKTRPRVVSLILLGAGLLVFLAYLALSILERLDLYFYLGGLVSPVWRKLLTYVFPPLLGVGGVLFVVRKLRSWACAGWMAALAFSLVFLLIAQSFTMDYRHIEITSPASAGKCHELVFVERYHGFFDGDGTVYEKTSPFFLRRIGSYTASDFYFPVFTPEADGIEWREDGLTIRMGEHVLEIDYYAREVPDEANGG